MEDAVRKGLEEGVRSMSGLVGGDANLLKQRYEKEKIGFRQMGIFLYFIEAFPQ